MLEEAGPYVVPLPLLDVFQPPKVYPAFVSAPVLPAIVYAVPPLTYEPFAGTEPVPPLAL